MEIIVDVITQVPIHSRYTSWWQDMFIDSSKFRCQIAPARALDTKPAYNWFTNLEDSILWDAGQVVTLLISKKPVTHVLLADLDFPGLAAAALPCLRLKYPNIKVSAILHAGSWCNGDIFAGDSYKRQLEQVSLNNIQTIMVATEYHKNKIEAYFQRSFPNIEVLGGLPFYKQSVESFRRRAENRAGVVILGRKEQSAQIKEIVPEADVLEQPLPRAQYLQKLAGYKYAILPKLEETFGYQALECAALQVIPIVPDAYSYLETMPPLLRFRAYEDIPFMLQPDLYAGMLKAVIEIDLKQYQLMLNKIYSLCIR